MKPNEWPNEWPCPKSKRLEWPKYIVYVKTLPCASCGIQNLSDAHHVSIRCLGDATMGQGQGTKPNDSQVIPLCRVCHGLAHSEPEFLKRDTLEWVKDRIIKQLTDFQKEGKNG